MRLLLLAGAAAAVRYQVEFTDTLMLDSTTHQDAFCNATAELYGVPLLCGSTTFKPEGRIGVLAMIFEANGTIDADKLYDPARRASYSKALHDASFFRLNESAVSYLSDTFDARDEVVAQAVVCGLGMTIATLVKYLLT